MTSTYTAWYNRIKALGAVLLILFYGNLCSCYDCFGWCSRDFRAFDEAGIFWIY